MNLSLSLTFLSLVFWTWVIGPLGSILAIPLTLLTKALLVDIDPRTRWLNHVLSSSPPDAPPANPETNGQAGPSVTADSVPPQ